VCNSYQYHLLFKIWLNGNGTTLLIVNGRISIVLLNTKANPCVYCVMVVKIQCEDSASTIVNCSEL
jgi:hypothetical protein